MENPDNKKELDKVPEVDENGEPIYKIDNADEHSKNADDVPLLIKDNPETPQGNEQDIKEENSEE